MPQHTTIWQRVFFALAALLMAIALFVFFSDRHGHAQQAPAEPTVIRLPAGQKLEGVSWACASSGYCTPTWLTRSMRSDELPEGHTLRNDSGLPTYVFYERRF